MANVIINTFKDSSVLAACMYRATDKILVMQFHSGAIWAYLDVPQEKFASLLRAKSAGKYFNQFIRNTYETQLVYKPKAQNGEETQEQEN